MLLGCEASPPGERQATDPSRTDSARSHVAEAGQTVRLVPAKLSAAGIHTTTVERRTLEEHERVPGRIDYEASRQLELRVPADCMVKQVLARAGQRVREQDPLAVLCSPEVGLARSTISQREAERDLARSEHDWLAEVAKNVSQLLDELAQNPTLDQLQETFRDRRLSEHRDQLLTAYSELLLARHRAAGGDELRDRGVLSDRTLQQRRSELEIAEAAFRTVCEESRRQASVQEARAAAEVAQAERMLRISQERLRALLGPFSDHAHPDEDALSEFVLCSPIDGTLEAHHVAAAMHVPGNEPLFRISDIDVVWVCGQIHQRRWGELSVRAGQELAVQTPALPDQRFTASIQFVGTSVSPETLAIPLVAELANPEHRFKPGMFVWVTVPMSEPRTVLAVQASAVLRHEGQTFVFVAQDDATFRRVDVTTGLETDAWIEISAGLQAGQRVVDEGAFYLKSELLLEHEVD
jgi:cobalt-zinc-cadmium efflux system membrane fusion protein